MRKIFITGGSGVLGNYVLKTFSSDKLYLPSHSEVDILDIEQLNKAFEIFKPEVVIHLAAKTNVDECEKYPKEAMLVNSEGTKNLAILCNKFNSFLVYVSTAAVFDGEKEFFSEDDLPNPINIYGKSKLSGEKFIEGNLSDYLIIRAGWLIGGGKNEKKFVSYIINQAKENNPIKAVNDKVGTITYAKDLSFLIKKLLDEKQKGLFHFGSRGVCSRFEIAKKILEVIGKDIEVIPVPSSYFEKSFSAPRPKREVIKSKRIEFPKTWEESLTNYLTEEVFR